MEKTKTRNNVRAQGVGSPVPATVRGGAVGPGSSLSNDCESTPVGHLAGLEKKNATSGEEESTLSPALMSSTDVRAPPDEIEAIRIQLLETGQRFEKSLQETRELLAQMKNSTKVQRNVNSTGQDGLPVLEEKVSELLDAKRTCGLVRGRLALLIVEPAQATPTGGKKRSATSPPIPLSEWIEVTKKAKKTKKKPSTETEGRKKDIAEQPKSTAPQLRPKEVPARADSGRKKWKAAKSDAIILKPASGKTFADILSTVRSTVEPEKCGVELRSVRRTRAGEVLLELKKGAADNRAAYSEALKAAVGSTSSVRELVPKVVQEIRDLDSYSTKEEIMEALRRDLKEYDGVLHIGTTRPNDRQQCMAIVTVEETAAATLMQTARIKNGWINCRIRRRAVVPRCFRCLGFGHHGSGCRGPDRSRLCFRCGAEGHKAAACAGEQQCFLCPAREDKPDSRNHMAGSGTCESFREALEKAKKKWQ